MSETTTDRPDTAPEQLADVIAGVCAEASMPALVIRLGRESGTSSAAVTGRVTGVTGMTGCHALPVMHVGEDFTDTGQAEACGAAAHEAAHITLGHADAKRRFLRFAILAVIAVIIAAAALPRQVPSWVPYLMFGAFYLARCQVARRYEYQADVGAVEILDRAGVPGRASMTATLRGLGGDPTWFRYGGWLFVSHPPTARRIAALNVRTGA